jgi:deoxycytidylate deaminase
MNYKIATSKKDRSFLNLAMKVAGLSEYPFKHGAVIVMGGRVMALGVNKDRNAYNTLSHKEAALQSTVHAEIDALSKVKNVKGAVMYVARVNNKGEPMFSYPCLTCFMEMKRRGVKLVFST